MTPESLRPDQLLPDDLRIASVVFDLDGLLVNTEELYQAVGSDLLRRRGKILSPDLLDAMMGRPQQVALATMIAWHNLSDSIETLAAETKKSFSALLDSRLLPMPGAVALVEALVARGTACGVATSSGPDFAHDVLERIRLRHRFAFVLTAADVVHGKPDPEIYRTAASRLKIPPHTMLVLEDSQAGCRAAVLAGAMVVAVPSGRSLQHDFTGVRLIAESLDDPRLHALLRQHALT